MDPDFPVARSTLAAAYATNDMFEEALHERLEIFRRSGRNQEAEELEAATKEGGEPGMLRWQIRRGLPNAEKARAKGGGGNRAWNMAVLYARLGEIEDGFKWLEEAVRQHTGYVIYAKVAPWLDSLRPDPRFGEILKKMNLAD